MAAIPDKYLDLLQQKKAFANLATLMRDGSPQVTPVWFDYTGGVVRVNTAKGRVKVRNLKAGSPVALAIMDPDQPYRYVQIRGGGHLALGCQSPSAAPVGSMMIENEPALGTSVTSRMTVAPSDFALAVAALTSSTSA